MPKLYGGTGDKNSMHNAPAMRIEGDGTKIMNTGNTKASLGDITWKGKK